MDSSQKTRLNELLVEAGAGSAEVSPIQAWEAFKQYGREVFDQSGVGLLFQVGTFPFTGERLFYFDPVIQFEVLDDEGSHDHYEQLHCELTCPPPETLEGIETNMWSFQCKTADEFFADVEALPEFRLAISQPKYRLRVIHHEV